MEPAPGGSFGSSRCCKMIPVPHFFLVVTVCVARFLRFGGCSCDGSIRLVDLSRCEAIVSVGAVLSALSALSGQDVQRLFLLLVFSALRGRTSSTSNESVDPAISKDCVHSTPGIFRR